MTMSGVNEIHQLAQLEAMQNGHSQLGPEHFLLGLLASKSKVYNHILSQTNLDLVTAREFIQATQTTGFDRSEGEELPLTEQSKSIMEYTWNVAVQLSHAWLDERHLWLGLLKSENNLAIDTLLHFGHNIEELRAETIKTFEI
ncbi:MAG: hypothetical protein IPL73_09600 [Candidatus Obscuribacter sp.]|jgi:ATP-dependent Clp protease ATP-binding subunit ClpA|nr:hypothetical protein [Candidatus Obscuribacter sp.]MBK9202674.1 hypothetical protein [Candidatus Obscuribacter sp.]MBK9621227.1 hypothetical protein [Candidatus Obscuribacter sp.]